MLNAREIELLELFARKHLGEHFDTFDFKSEIDASLTYGENQSILLEKFAIHLLKALPEPIGTKKELTALAKEQYRNEHIGENIGFEEIFKQGRIIGYAGNRNTGKTNSLVCLIKRFREHNKTTEIYVYGFPSAVVQYLKQYGVKEISTLRQLINKKDCILIIDEMQKLKLNDRRYLDLKQEFSDYIYHDNNYAILTSPSIREFNSVIGSIIEGWMVKSIDIGQCVNGSQLKQVVDEYKGDYKTLGSIELPQSEILLLNNNEEIVIHCDYIAEADTKRNQRDLFVKELSGKSQNNKI